MDVAETQAQGTTDHGEISHQVQNRLLHIDTQMTHIRAQVERLITEASTSSSQFTVLTGCEFSAAQELLVVATEEGNSSIREWCGQKNVEDSGAQPGTKCR
jgi:hypothetical protein